LTVLAVEVPDPSGYGRILLDNQRRVEGIVEEADATEEQRRLRTINAGIYCVEKAFLTQALKRLQNDNAQGEYYLTDIVGIGARQERKVGAMVWEDSEEVMGVNTRKELKLAEIRLRKRTGKTS
jgi:bifunctional N-acetylglucosamine-1-phosphate-uridyltransferase/glucosamine-1-phosphate-acetyltransferase GlmU-like protein